MKGRGGGVPPNPSDFEGKKGLTFISWKKGGVGLQLVSAVDVCKLEERRTWLTLRFKSWKKGGDGRRARGL